MAMDSKKFSKILKGVNIIVGLINIALGIISIFYVFKDIVSAQIFLIAAPIWLTIFGIINVLVEFNIKWITKHLSFMGNLFGRGLFNIFLGSLFYTLLLHASSEVVAWICCTIMTVIGIVYMFLECCLTKQYKQAYLNQRLI